MSWHWEPGFAPGEESGAEQWAAEGGRTDFPTQADAEAWLGETHADWVDLGVVEVSLFEDGRRVYGPMGLTAG